MNLSELAVRNAKTATKPLKLFDGGGLFLFVTPNGGKCWRLKYRFGGKEKLLALGTYPEVSLKEARVRREEARKQLAADIDPGVARKVMKAAIVEQEEDLFEVIAREWIAKFSPTWSEIHSSRILARLEKDVFPWIGRRPIKSITAPEMLAVLRRIEERGALEIAHRALQNSSRVFRYAVATGRAERDITSDLRGALPPTKEKHVASLTDPNAVASLLRAIEGYQGSLVTRCALRMAPLVFVRPGELRRAEWTEFDFDKAEWRITTSANFLKPVRVMVCQDLKESPFKEDVV